MKNFLAETKNQRIDQIDEQWKEGRGVGGMSERESCDDTIESLHFFRSCLPLLLGDGWSVGWPGLELISVLGKQ